MLRKHQTAKLLAVDAVESSVHPSFSAARNLTLGISNAWSRRG
jgi:hypothetical protein